MNVGSFPHAGKQIDVERGWSAFDGVIYRLVDAKTREEIAVSRHRGLDLAEDGQDKELAAGLRAGLRTVLGLQP